MGSGIKITLFVLLFFMDCATMSQIQRYTMRYIKHSWILIFVLPLSCGSSSTPTKEIKLSPPTGDKIYFGAFPDFGGTEENITSQRIQKFETIAGKKSSGHVSPITGGMGSTTPEQRYIP
jgi:hypothetical protein